MDIGVLLLLCTALCTGTSGKVEADNKRRHSESLAELTTKYKGILENVLQQIMPIILRATSEANLTPDCTQTLFQMILGFRQLDEWAVSMVDASGKLQSGAFDGSATHFGDYDECLGVTALRPNFAGDLEESFRGQYCLVEVSPPQLLTLPPFHREDLRNASIFKELEASKTIFKKVMRIHSGLRLSAARIGICFPSKCKIADVQKLVQMTADPLELGVKVLSCETRGTFAWKSEHVGIVSILGILCILSIMGTLVELFAKKGKDHNLPHKRSDFCVPLWKSFSAISNTKRFLNRQNSYKDLTCLHGIRFLTMCWIVLAHTYFFPYAAFFYRFKRLISVVEFQDELVFGLFGNPSPAIDTLFVMGGLFLSYQSGRLLTITKHGLGLWAAFIRRALQFLPSLILTIFLFMLLPLIGDGPQWNDLVNRNIDVCRYNWWKSLLFIQNYWKFSENCMMHTWFLSLSVQYCFFSIFLVWLLYKKVFFGLLINVGLIVGSSLALGYLNAFNKFPPSLKIIDIKLWEDIMNKDYLRTYAHIGPFCIGLLTGFLIIKQKKPKLKPILQWIGWIVCLSFIFAVLFGLHKWNQTQENSISLAASYAGAYRPVWSFSIAWICFACVTGNAGVLNTFLSSKKFIQFDRLSNLLYLLHPLVIFYYSGRGRERVHFGHPEMIINFLGTIVLTLLISFFCYVVLQAPFHYLDRLLFEKDKPEKEVEIEKEIPDPERVINIYKSDGNTPISSEPPSRQPDAVPRRRKRSSVSFSSKPFILNPSVSVDASAGPSGPVTPMSEIEMPDFPGFNSELEKRMQILEEEEREDLVEQGYKITDHSVTILSTDTEPSSSSYLNELEMNTVRISVVSSEA